MPSTLIVPGFPKAGTTSLLQALAAHPAVLLPSIPAPALFGKRYDPGLTALGTLYDLRAAHQVLCDRTVSYVTDDLAPSRIAKHFPDARFIVCVREPVKRTISHYRFLLGQGKELASIEEILTQGFSSPYLDNSRYGHHAQRFLDHFPLDRFLFLDIEGDGEADALQRVWSFLDIQPVEVDAESLHANQGHIFGSLGTYIVTNRTLRRLVPRYVKRVAKPLLPRVLRLGRRLDSSLPLAERRRLADLLRPEIAHFSELTGYDTTSWEASWP